MTQGMYQQQILDHGRHPRNFRAVSSPDATVHRANPLCGDEVDVFVSYDEQGRVKEATFTGRGCAISTAATSMLTERLRGKTKDEIKAMTEADVTALLGVTVNPARRSCATLGLEAFRAAVTEKG